MSLLMTTQAFTTKNSEPYFTERIVKYGTIMVAGIRWNIPCNEGDLVILRVSYQSVSLVQDKNEAMQVALQDRPYMPLSQVYSRTAGYSIQKTIDTPRHGDILKNDTHHAQALKDCETQVDKGKRHIRGNEICVVPRRKHAALFLQLLWLESRFQHSNRHILKVFFLF